MTDSKKILHFMRHGQTNYNVLGLCNDDPRRNVHLTESGRQQAADAAEKLKQTRIERIIVSELPRTRQTAEIVNRYHHAPIEVNPAINDIVTGFDGRPVADYFAACEPDRLTVRPPGGESLLDYKQRVTPFIHWLVGQPQREILTVAHEETLRVIAAYFEQIEDAAMQELQFGNCAVLSYSLD